MVRFRQSAWSDFACSGACSGCQMSHLQGHGASRGRTSGWGEAQERSPPLRRTTAAPPTPTAICCCCRRSWVEAPTPLTAALLSTMGPCAPMTRPASDPQETWATPTAPPGRAVWPASRSNATPKYCFPTRPSPETSIPVAISCSCCVRCQPSRPAANQAARSIVCPQHFRRLQRGCAVTEAMPAAAVAVLPHLLSTAAATAASLMNWTGSV